MTYSDPAVISTINQLVIPVQINVTEATAQPILQKYRQYWTPDLRILGPDGFSYAHWMGYLPPFEYLPQLLVSLGRAGLATNDLKGAASFFEDVTRRFPTSRVAPEATYFRAVARYKESHHGPDLIGGWQQLQSRYPESIWRVKQSFIENPSS